MILNLTRQLAIALSLLGTAFLGAACSSSASTASPNSSAGSGGLSSNGGASATAGTGGEAGTGTCLDVTGSPAPANFGNCDSGACFSCPVTVQGIPWINNMFFNTDTSGPTQQTLSNPAGKVCMAGTSLGYAALILGLGAKQPEAFDAQAHGITQVEFTIETPPSVGVLPELDALVPPYMPPPAGFELASGVVSTSTPQRALFSDFQSPGLTLDPSQILAIAFSVGAAEHYDFCVRDLKFLDAAGVEVLPTP